MSTGLIIAVSILFGLTALLFVLGRVYSNVRRDLEDTITEYFKKEEILGATTRANFLGVRSKGGAQWRGNGALVLTSDVLFFLRAVPKKEYRIPIRAITSLSMPKSFNGKSVLAPLLCVNYHADEGEESIAWALRNPEKWKAAIEARISHGKKNQHG